MFRLLAYLLSSCIVSTSASAATLNISGPLEVLDGDTLSVGPAQIRLSGIDAPEKGQRCALSGGSEWNYGRSSTRFMIDLTATGTLTCQPEGSDPYGRIVASCSVDGVDLAGAMIDAGLAWAFTQYSDRYVQRETIARNAGIGVFQAETQTAQEYRDNAWQRAVEASPNGCPIKGNINGDTRVYHTPWSPNYSQTKIDTSKGERWFCSETEALLAEWTARR